MPPDDSNDSGGAQTITPDTGGSEFSKPTGVGDDAIFNKYFGKDAKGWDDEKPEKKEAKPKADKKPEPKAKDDKDEPAKKTDKPTEKKADKDSKPEPKAKKDDEAPDPGKARKLYAEAKKATDPKQSRKLYEQAVAEALGELPPEFSGAAWKASREKKAKDLADVQARSAQVETRIQEAATKLKPAIYVMGELNKANLGEKLTAPLVGQAIEVMRAIQELKQGDYTRLGDIIEKASGQPRDEALKLFVRGVKVSPEGRASRAAAEAAQQEAAAARRELAEYKAQLAERDQVQTKTQEAARQRQLRADYAEQIETELAGHPALKLPNATKRILAYLIKTRNPQTKTARYTFDQVADKLVAHETERLKSLRGVIDTDGEEPAQPTSIQRVSAVPRGQQADVGVLNESPEAAWDRIWNKNNQQQRRAR